MWGEIIGGALGAIAGGQGDSSSQTYKKILAPESELEKQAGKVAGGQLSELEKLLGSQYGTQQDLSQGAADQRGLNDLLRAFSQGGFLPNQQDFSQAQQYTNDVFAPQTQQLQDNFDQAKIFADREAVRMGRSANDPILRNKLLQEQTRQQNALNSQQTAFRSQFAQSIPLQRLQFAQQLAGVQGDLASRAMANRQALFSMGNQLRGQEQNFRLGSATTEASSQSGGGLSGALMGGLAGVGMGSSIASKMGGFSFGDLFKSSPAAAGGSNYLGMPSLTGSLGMPSASAPSSPFNFGSFTRAPASAANVSSAPNFSLRPATSGNLMMGI